MKAFNGLYKFLTYSGATYGIIGALFVALGYRLDVGYVLFFLSSSSWFLVGVIYKEKALAVMNFVFTVINIIGLYTYIIKVG